MRDRVDREGGILGPDRRNLSTFRLEQEIFQAAWRVVEWMGVVEFD